MVAVNTMLRTSLAYECAFGNRGKLWLIILLALRIHLVSDRAGCITVVALWLCLSVCLSVTFAVARTLDGIIVIARDTRWSNEQ